MIEDSPDWLLELDVPEESPDWHSSLVQFASSLSALAPGGRGEHITAERGLLAIIHEIESAPDPFKAAGQWITKVTNAITETVREK